MEKKLTHEELKEIRLKLTALAQVNKSRMLKMNAKKKDNEQKILNKDREEYIMTDKQKSIHNYAPFWERAEAQKKFFAESEPPTPEQVNAQRERQARDRGELNKW